MKLNIPFIKSFSLSALILIITFNTQAENNLGQKTVPVFNNLSKVLSNQPVVKCLSFNGSLVNNEILINWITSHVSDGFENDTSKEYTFKRQFKIDNKQISCLLSIKAIR